MFPGRPLDRTGQILMSVTFAIFFGLLFPPLGVLLLVVALVAGAVKLALVLRATPEAIAGPRASERWYSGLDSAPTLAGTKPYMAAPRARPQET